MKKAIIITSIFEPTKAINLFSKYENYQLIVVGDKKSPNNWQCEGVEFLSVDKQEELKFFLSQLLPYNHYCRKMIGYLKAIKDGYEVIIDTDDDNVPYNGWSFPEFNGEFLTTDAKLGFVNIYKSFTDKHIWPRGFPLDKILDEKYNQPLQKNSKNKFVKIGVWQGLADGDPDVDAIYRLTLNTECIFDKNDPVVLSDNTISPFNSQNTAFRKECFALLYMPAFVTFRFTDILRGLVAQPILWKAGYQLGFLHATVFQERNPHNYLRDFESEIPCYLHVEKVIELVDAATSTESSIEENLFNAYSALEKAGIVPAEEIELLKLWLKDLK